MDQAVTLLEGKGKQLIRELTAEMERAAEDLEFERAAALRSRITALRGLARQEKDADAAKLLRSRIAALLPLWQEARDLARITAHYYDKEAHR